MSEHPVIMGHIRRNLLQPIPVFGNLSVLDPRQVIDRDRLISSSPLKSTKMGTLIPMGAEFGSDVTFDGALL